MLMSLVPLIAQTDMFFYETYPSENIKRGSDTYGNVVLQSLETEKVSLNGGVLTLLTCGVSYFILKKERKMK